MDKSLFTGDSIKTEQWDEVQDELIPGRKSMRTSISSMMVFVAAFFALLTAKGSSSSSALRASIIYITEGAFVYLFSTILPPGTLKSPLSSIGMYFAILGFITLVFVPFL